MQMITLHLQWVVVQNQLINKVKTVAESLTLWFRNNCKKVNPDKFHLLLSDKNVITWIFAMRSFQVRAVKSLSGLKLIIDKKSALWQEFHL